MIDISADHLELVTEAALLVRDGTVCYVNRAAEGILGRHCVGKPLKELLGEDFPEMEDGSYIGEAELKGERFLVRMRTLRGTTSVFLAKDEETEIVNDALLYGMHSRLEGLTLTLNAVRERAEDIGDEKLLEALAGVTENGLAIRRSIDNLTVVHQLQAGRVDCAFSKFDVCLMLRELADTVNLLRRGDPFVSVRTDREETIIADYAKVELLLLNLISNSLRHAHGAKNIVLNVVRSGANVILSVDDDGCGIAEEELTRTFSRFAYRYSQTELPKGAGLGLTVARGIAKAHGGTLLLESSPGEGTRVRVSLRRTQELKQANSAVEGLTAKRMDRVLAGLSDCLDRSCFREQFFD